MSSKAVKSSRVTKKKHPLGDLGGTYFDQNGVPRFILPKVLKSDSRRLHPEMFVRVFNSCDMSLMTKYIKEFARPDFVFQNCAPEHMHITKAPFVDCSSHDSLMVWSALVHVTPDIILDLCEARLRVRSDNTSTVEFSFAITGTAVLPNNTSPIMAGARPPDPCLVDDSDLDQSIDSLMEDVTSNDSSSTHDTFEMRDLSEQLNNKMVLSRKDLKPTYQRHIRQAYDVMNAVHKNDLLATPHRTVQLRFRGNVKMHLDNEHRIWLMQWVVH